MYEASGTNSNIGDIERIVDVSNDEDDQGFKTSNSKVKNVCTDFGPFALKLSQACFPANATSHTVRPNGLTYEMVLAILEEALEKVTEPIMMPKLCTKWQAPNAGNHMCLRGAKQTKWEG
ncbi:hypothetical protein L208DRAFT_1381359 [Tricholoma matsutake]|nr:hypothetical protein L208DRAFT_1381359 [Tricholoma matsutake 945]